MSSNVVATENFQKEAKSLLKKYPSLKKELANLGMLLAAAPETGAPLGKGCYKIRLAIASKGSGKSGGARVITYCYVAEETVFLLSIYDKSERSTLTDKEIQALLENI